ncbi:MAG: type II toxin-antitoxin system RelE/ParE family toxin [Oscillospiraceae bacterium]|jgi:plasmid stabilization system protein ParE|nr:type II toxin-antitoxin system RelE/ParE family toxin [Oscillospiraceae bacterium]
MKKYELRFTPSARDDLHSIEGYIAQDHPIPAHKMRERIAAKAEELAIFPGRGKSASLLGYFQPEMRFVAEGKYYIFYKVSGDQVIVYSIVHSARDIGRLLTLLDFDEQDQ